MMPQPRIGVIIPTSNRMTEPQFQYYAPHALGVHFTRARITGRWRAPVAELAPEVARAASMLADAKVDLILFHCTGTSMQEGRAGDARLIETIERETGIATLSTATAIAEALAASNMKRLVLITPYVQATNDHEKDYLREAGFAVVHDVALGLKGGDEFITVPPTGWIELARANDRATSDGFFLSCTNTTQIEAIAAIESATGKPVVNSNQAALWAAVNRLRAHYPSLPLSSVPGRLNKNTPPSP